MNGRVTAVTGREIVTASPGSTPPPGRREHISRFPPDVSRTPEDPTTSSRRAAVASTPPTASAAPAVKRDRTHYLYIAVIVAVALGIAVGLIWPDAAVELKPLGTGFVNLIKMMISPIIFCTIVLGIGS